ncbi:ATP-binding protein [Anaerofustis stercorihominis]|uniref:ATP-binding protein n=1 Tax=Anaerofustis stercorihominis TaxID=214853 RepID=UPI00214B70BF|nr:ATP-binding protein [Anaerofustis stercorihominis]MCR2033458.1 ATP-binding protein [Anaerofustis stercorihominis]
MEDKEISVSNFNNKRKVKEKELSNKIDIMCKNYPSIKTIIDKINAYGLYACMNDISNEIFENRNIELNNQLKTELEKLGFDKDYLSLKYDCEKCKDSGYVNNEMCTCLKEYLKKRKKKNSILFRDGSFDNFDENLFDNDKRKYQITPRENIIKNKEQSLKFINTFEDEKNILGLLMSGKVGSGKTFLAAATGKMLLNKGYSVICLTAKEFEDIIKSFNDPDLEKKKKEILDVDLLILDDLGIETQSDYVNNEILKLIDYKMTYNKKMIMTTNLTLNEIREKYKSRIYSRIVSNFKYLKFFGPDIRVTSKMKKNQ